MKIGILGAPGSGKTELAEALKTRLDGTTSIVDNYVDEIGRECDLAMGTDANYIGNLYVVLGRYAKERKAQRDADNVITCGSMIESSVYATLNTMSQPPGHEATNWTRITNFMNVLGSIFQDTMTPPEGYDHIFVLSLEDSDTETPIDQIDKNIFMAINVFGLPYVPVSGTIEERVEQALDQIRGDHEVSTEASE